jgi:hypothetical protein
MGHGDHWRAVEKECEIFIDTMLPLVFKEGTPVGENAFSHTLEQVEGNKEGIVHGYQYPDPDSPVSLLVLVATGLREGIHDLWSAYPVCSDRGCYRMEVYEVYPRPNGVEGAVEAALPEGDSISFFDPFFFLNKEKYQEGEQIEVAFSALAYRLESFELDEAEIAERLASEVWRRKMIEDHVYVDVVTPTTLPLTAERAADYYPLDGVDDSAEIEFYIEEVIPVACLGRIFWRMTGVIMRAVDTELRIDVYASEQVLNGYQPKIGDNVAALVWVQGRLRDRAEDPAPGQGAQSQPGL